MVAGAVLIEHGLTRLHRGLPIEAAILPVLATSAGIFLVAGLWMPVTGALVAVIELWNTFSQPGDPRTHILLAALGAALAMVGPGAWSIDARLFGWKRIDLSDRNG